MNDIGALLTELRHELGAAAERGEESTCDALHSAIADVERTAFLLGVQEARSRGILAPVHNVLDAVLNG